MSYSFNSYNTRANPDVIIARGLGYGGGAAVGVPGDVAIVPPMPYPLVIPLTLQAELNYIEHRWRNRSEAERRVQIDAYVSAVLDIILTPLGALTAYPAAGAFIFPSVTGLRVVAEQHVASTPGGVLLNGQVGHGHLDYLLSRPVFTGGGAATHNNRLRPSVIIEAKASLGPNHDQGQWQLCAEMATACQLYPLWGNIVRGVLSDGRFWRFYEMETATGWPWPPLAAPILRRSVPLDATNLADFNAIVWMFHEFTNHYTNHWWPLL